MGVIAQTIVPSVVTSLRLAERMCEGVAAGDFGRKPAGVECNTPAWVFGHLAMYPDKVIEWAGRADVAQPLPDGWPELFGYKSECRDDPKGAIYPSKERVVSEFMRRQEALVRVLGETDDAVLMGVNPHESMRERFPTLGAIAAFMGSAHVMMHLGQVSTWRRCMGLGPAM